MAYRNYGGYNDPARYYVEREQARQNQMQNILSLIMQMRMMQGEREQQKWKRGVTERELGLREQQLAQPREPSAAEIKAQMLMQAGMQPRRALRIGAGITPKPKKKLPTKIPPQLEGWFQGKGVRNWRDLTPEQFDYHRDIWKTETTRQTKEESVITQQARIVAKERKIPLGEAILLVRRQPQAEREITPTSIATGRRQNRKDVGKTWMDIKTKTPEAFTTPEQIEFYRTTGVHIDLPAKYSVAMRNIADNYGTQTDQDYVSKVDLTKAWFDRHKDEENFKLEAIPSSIKKELDIETLKILFKAYKPKRKKLLGIL